MTSIPRRERAGVFTSGVADDVREFVKSSRACSAWERRVTDYDCRRSGTGNGDSAVFGALSAWLSTVSYDPR
jgi:hypothetical protein